jgi:hypothetical protein
MCERKQTICVSNLIHGTDHVSAYYYPQRREIGKRASTHNEGRGSETRCGSQGSVHQLIENLPHHQIKYQGFWDKPLTESRKGKREATTPYRGVVVHEVARKPTSNHLVERHLTVARSQLVYIMPFFQKSKYLHVLKKQELHALPIRYEIKKICKTEFESCWLIRYKIVDSRIHDVSTLIKDLHIVPSCAVWEVQ